MATTGTLMTAKNIYGLVNPPPDPSGNDPLVHQTINSGATNWGSHIDLSNATVRVTTNQTIAGDKTFTGTVIVPTPVESDNTTKIATTAFVKTSIDNLVDGAPNTLNTLNELAAAMGDDNNFHTTMTTALAGKHVSITSSARLNANLIGDNGNVSNTEYGYLDGVTSAIQTQINSKQATITNGSITLQQVNALESILNSKAPLNGPVFEGSPIAPTATAGTNTTQLATTAFVKTAVDNLIDSAPGALDTLNELAAAIGDDANYAATVTTALSGKHPSITTSARLNANLIGDNGDVSNTEYGYLNGVTSAIQTQIDSKQATITDGDLTIARTSGLQAALDAKQATITDASLTIARTNGLQAALDSKQATITDASLTIARTNGLQAALDSKQATITDASLTIARTNGLQAALDSKQATIVDGDLTIARTSGLQTALDLKAPLAGPTFTGTPAAPTATAGTNTTQLATTAFVKTSVDNLVSSAPGALDTLNELAAAIGDDANYAATVTTALATKHPSITTSARLDANLIGANGDVSNTEYGYLNGVTSAIQTQIDSKQATITDASLTIARTNGLQAALDAKQATITDASLTIARTNGLQAALDSKHGNITSSVDVSMNNLWVQGDISCNGGIEFKGHILPQAHETYDIGAADKKIRHLFLSDNSLWIGDDHKIDITGGKMKFKKRKKDGVPASILAAGGDAVAALAFTSGVGQLEDMLLHHWEEYARTLNIAGKGVGNALIEDIFVGGTAGDWEEDGALDGKQPTITSSSDISMNNLWVEGDISCNSTLKVDTINENTDTSGVTIDSVLLKDNTVTAHTVNATNYAVGGTNFISATRQGNFRDLEVKNSSNTETILLTGDGGHISINGTLSADTIGEKTSATGVTIDSVLLKDNIVTAHTVNATNYAVGGTNFISASRQGNFRDLEVKDSGNSATILLTGDGGDISINGTLSADTIGEKTDSSGVTIDGVLLKDGAITATGTTQTAGNNTTQLATTAFVKTAIDNLVDSAPGALDTLNELAAAIGDDANYAATVTTALSGKQASITTSARLNANLIHDGSVSNTIFGRLANVTDDIQAQLNAKQASLTSTGSGSVITSLERTNWKDVSDNAVRITGAQTVAGAKTFTSNIIGNLTGDITGNAGTVTNGVYTTGNQTIGGVKTFSSDITGDLAGNSSTATALENTRTIAGQNFNGTQNVSIAAADLSDITSAGSGIIITATERTDYTDVSNNAVRLTGAQTVAGAKTFSSAVTVGNYTLPATAGTQGQVLKYPASGSTLTWGSSGSGGSSIDTTTDVSLNDLGVYGDLSCNAVKLGGHIIPDTNAAYDLGNAEYKIRHLFLSDNSLWIGDDHKIDISGGKMKFKKRKKTAVPAAITSASGSDSAALTHAGLSNLSDMKLHHWEAYAHTLSGLENANIQDIFSPNTAGDWEEDEELGGSSSTTTKKGQVLEVLKGICDGRTVEVESGTYTLQNVTAIQNITDLNWNIITGSSISYKPPTGTKKVCYQFRYQWYATLFSLELYIDGVASGIKRGIANNRRDDYDIVSFSFEIGGNTTDASKGIFSSWDSNKTLDIRIHRYSSSYDTKLHGSNYWEGSSSTGTGLQLPTVKITAIGEGTVGAVSNAVTTSGDQTIAGTKTFSNAIISASYTTTQRDALTAVAGMVIFNTTVNKHQGYNGSSWNDFY
jgi:hypothetical protein